MQIPMNFILLLIIGGGFLAYIQPFPGALWVGIACVAIGIYMAWRLGRSIRKRREEYEKSQKSQR